MHLDLALEREENKAREEQLVEQLQESKGFEHTERRQEGELGGGREGEQAKGQEGKQVVGQAEEQEGEKSEGQEEEQAEG
jgi:hypothetical protein